MSIIILEVPHQRRPSVWVARDEQHLIQMASEVHDFCYPADADSEIDAAKEAIGHDLSQCYFLSISEAKEFKGHADAEIALNKFIEDNDYLFGEEA